MAKQVSDAIAIAEALCRRFEGCHTRNKEDGLIYPYHDPIGLPTQGWGHLLSREKWAPLSRWPSIPQEQADEWLRCDLALCAREVARLCPVYLEPHQKGPLLSFTFNFGSGNLSTSVLRRCVNRGDHEEAANQFGRWVFAGGRKLPGLIRRRAAEAAIYRGEL